ncbi:MAG: acyl-CoA transferase [Rhodobacteraceae bacterium]|nr:acyl-CoA transferase [Paracoccaceae bacterium]
MSLLSSLPDPGVYQTTGAGYRPSAFAVSELATASVAAVGCELARLITALNLGPSRPEVTVDHRLASLWYGWSFKPQGWEMPDAWDAIAGDYRTADGWIKLHTNLPHHRAAALSVLRCDSTREAVAAAVNRWDSSELESNIVAAGGVAASMRSRTDWQSHPQGQAMASDPLVLWGGPRSVQLRDRPNADAIRPLKGLRVLDLTRVLAGPVATRTLAGFGADVLRIDPPGWDEPGVIPDISLGKRCAYLDLKTPAGLETCKSLLAQADVLVHGYRPGALQSLGLGEAERNRIAPNRIEITLDAYGWSGPWAGRRGFDSLVQMSGGIAATGMEWAQSDKPTPLPVQALDHATGYLMAAAVLSALSEAAEGRDTATGHLSLARTAELLCSLPKTARGPQIQAADAMDYSEAPEHSGWGGGHRLRPPLQVGQSLLAWDRPAGPLGRENPRFTN